MRTLNVTLIVYPDADDHPPSISRDYCVLEPPRVFFDICHAFFRYEFAAYPVFNVFIQDYSVVQYIQTRFQLGFRRFRNLAVKC